MTAPYWMERGLGWVGVHEDEKRAEDIGRLYANATGQPFYDPDETAWCSIFIGAMLGGKQFDLTGITPLVKSWLDLIDGKRIADLRDAEYGDIIVLDRTTDPRFGHGGFLVGQDENYIQILGGNQGDRVSIARFKRSRLAGIIRPIPNDGRIEKPAPRKHNGDDFDRAVSHVLDIEGGWSNDPDDPGGATNMGITIEPFRTWRAMNGLSGGSEAQLRALTPNEAREIYRTLYWDAAKCDSLDSWAMRVIHFDTAVNQGVARAIQFLQLSLGVEVDGQFGPKTASAEDRADQRTLLTEYAAQRMRHYGNLSRFGKYGLGWSRRLMRTLALAARDVTPETPALPQTPSPVPQIPRPTNGLAKVPNDDLIAALVGREHDGARVTKVILEVSEAARRGIAATREIATSSFAGERIGSPTRPESTEGDMTMNGIPTFPGMKTYGVSFLVVFIGVAEGLLGWDVPGVEVGPDWLDYVLTGLGVGSLRAALGKMIERVSGK